MLGVRGFLVCFRNRHQDFPGYRKKGGLDKSEQGEQMFRCCRFSFTVIRKKLLEYSFSISVKYT